MSLFRDYGRALRDLDQAPTLEVALPAFRSLFATAQHLASTRFRTTLLEERRRQFSETLDDMVRLYRDAAAGQGSNQDRQQLFDDVDANAQVFLSVRDYRCEEA